MIHFLVFQDNPLQTNRNAKSIKLCERGAKGEEKGEGKNKRQVLVPTTSDTQCQN